MKASVARGVFWAPLVLLMWASSSLAGGTPFWWNNPQEYEGWQQEIASGTAENATQEPATVTVVVDVPNEYNQVAYKYVWAQIEWTVVEGSGEFATGDNPIRWLEDGQQCPDSPSDPFPTPDGQDYMSDEGQFTPEWSYDNGNEMSFSDIIPQPACERIEFRFDLGSSSTIAYRIEVQTVCFEFDFGDAPDPTYPTRKSNDGARHVIDPFYRMGSGVDSETNGQATGGADGDDLDGYNDDDGVDFTPLYRGTTATLIVTVSAPGYFYAWIDLNADGDWDDAGEQIFEGLVSGGTTDMDFYVPSDAPLGDTYARCRFTSVSGLSYDSLAPDGEVEDYLLTIQDQPIELDYGDAPDPRFSTPGQYPTLLANNGARHVVVQGVCLGSSVDSDPDGQPDATALEDDTDGNDDEDGIVFVTSVMAGQQVTVEATASTAGFLDGWMDFNSDGDWADVDEQIFTAEALVAGVNSIQFDVPADAIIGNTFARFRFSQTGDLSYDGSASDGEVEDYLVEILVPVELSSFTATSVGGTVKVEWTTETETENLGFHVYRSESDRGDFSKITQELIPGAGNSESLNRYIYVDRNVEAGKVYFYKLADVSFKGQVKLHGPITISVEETIPTSYEVSQNYPNPFNPETTISFKLKDAGLVTLSVYDLRGRVVRRLISKQLDPGVHSVVWNGKDDHGNLMPSGTYLCTLRANGFEQTRKMAFMK